MKVKGWQLAVITLGLLVGIGSLVYSMLRSDTVEIKHVIHVVDVETGELYRINTEKYPTMLPARHPTNGKFCLIRVRKDDKSGQWTVGGRDLGLLKRLAKDIKNTAVDDQSGDLLITPKEPVEYVRK